jgi:hypothetical protein
MADRTWVLRWVIAANSLVVFLLVFTAYYGYRQTTQLRTLLAAPPTPVHQIIKSYFPLLCIVILLLTGMAVELARWKWAWLLNTGFYWFVFLSGVCQSVAAYPGPHPDEVMIGVIVIVVPSGTIAIITSILYLVYFRNDRSEACRNHRVQVP